ncbi:U-box domain-containing protein 33 [Linum perenne]
MADLSTSPPEPESGVRSSYYYADGSNRRHKQSSSAWEIEEEESELFEIDEGGPSSAPPLKLASIREEMISLTDAGSVFSVEVGGDDCLYVGVGKGESSVQAVAWALANVAAFTDVAGGGGVTVYLIHVFPEIHHIPSPLGKLPKSQVSPEQVESYMAQERGKRTQLLQKFITMCSASKVKVETLLIESDVPGRAIIDLIPILNIKNLVLGTNKSNVKKLKNRKGNANIADHVSVNAPEGCQVSIVCQGVQVMVTSPSRSSSPSPSPRHHKAATEDVDQLPPALSADSNDGAAESLGCMCFKASRVTT